MSNSYLSQHHSFDVDLATKLGSCELAILVHHFVHWIKYNEKLDRNFRDGKYWTYQTRKEICAHFTYWTPKQVRTLLDKLVSLDILIKGNYNTSLIDHTTWFTLNLKNKILAAHLGHCSGVTTEAKNDDLSGICPNGPLSAQTGKSIPDTKTTNTKEQQQQVVVVPLEKNVKKLNDFLQGFSKESAPNWEISPDCLEELMREYGIDLVAKYVNYMCDLHLEALDAQNNPYKNSKVKPIDKPMQFLCKALKDKWIIVKKNKSEGQNNDRNT
jgi:hypothetical protein